MTATGNMHGVRALHMATLLPDGKVLVAGGSSDGGIGVWLASAEPHNPGSGINMSLAADSGCC